VQVASVPVVVLPVIVLPVIGHRSSVVGGRPSARVIGGPASVIRHPSWVVGHW
jgi:hypothetical protein